MKAFFLGYLPSSQRGKQLLSISLGAAGVGSEHDAPRRVVEDLYVDLALLVRGFAYAAGPTGDL